jgi:hypothetical protein
MERSSRRLVLYVPEVSGWNELVESWSQTIHFPSKAGKGLQEFEMNTILDALANSI